MALIKKFPHRVQNAHQMEYGATDPGFDPEK
jgi:hypothetical protein